MRKPALAVLAAVLSTACSGSLFESNIPPPLRYVLAPAPKAATTVAPTPANLAIGRPSLSPGLDTDRIAVLKGRQLDYYRGVRWGDHAAEVVQSMLVASFEAQDLFRSVTAEQARIRGDYLLDVDVRDFQAEYTAKHQAPTARVALVGRLIRIADRNLVATLSAEATHKASEDRMGAVAAAFEAAAQQVSLELAQQTAAAIAEDEQALSSVGREAHKSR
jgi:cholesterol transport system auxiliary component